MKKIAVIGTQTEFKAFSSFLRRTGGVEFIRIDSYHQLQGLELAGYIDTGTIKTDIDQIIHVSKTRIR